MENPAPVGKQVRRLPKSKQQSNKQKKKKIKIEHKIITSTLKTNLNLVGIH